MLAEQVRIGNIEGVHSEVGPMFDPEDDKGFPTWDEQFYRIGGTTTGGVFLGGALSVAAGSGMLIGAFLGGLVGLGIAVAAAYLSTTENAARIAGNA